MLTCYGHRVRLPQNDLVYLACRLAVDETLSDVELDRDLDEEMDPPGGYLSEVPFLEQVPLPVQVDLLAEVWSRHRVPELFEASLLDAAIVYAACQAAARIVDDMPEVAVAWLASGPRKVNPRIIRRAAFRLEDMFERFWDDRDFLLIDEFQDLPPEQADAIKEVLRLPDEAIAPMYEALGRWRVSPEVAVNLQGLMTEDEIRGALPLLSTAGRCEDELDDDEDSFLPGLEDHYHGLLVGPCDPATAESEASGPLVTEVSVTDVDDFECSYGEWVEHLRDAVLREAQQPQVAPLSADAGGRDPTEQVRLAQTIVLADGTRIERREEGWVVVDQHGFFLCDPEDAAWVADVDDEEMPGALFESPEAAYEAYTRSCEVGQARVRRREEALRRLGKP